ncbi:DegT/DnrJ/EryC1/StrS family aminotransferase, partial [Streptomyces axinellae]|uniref:DegT/DnrJ/EryC1/StrS family aminotransferase n=1 Tax=Streptomyces axinellae TaxID=552788 RepID=UPI003CD0BFEC
MAVLHTRSRVRRRPPSGRAGSPPPRSGCAQRSPCGSGAACGVRTRAVVAVHQYGLPCDVAGIKAAVGPDVVVIEDVAQTWGSTVNGVPAGSLG